MADRYISEKALIENIAKIEDLRTLSTKTIGEAISNTPTADVVEVVRCKDCKRCHKHRTKRNKQLMYFCWRMDGNEYQVNANDFCSYGRRRDI